MIVEIHADSEMKAFGAKLGALLKGGETIELVGDVGAGKTTLAKGIAAGLTVDEDVQSPSFTISRVYEGRDKLRLVHYDFYRLHDPGIMANELHETIHDDSAVTVVEWAGIVGGVLPVDCLNVAIKVTGEMSRQLVLKAGGPKSQELLEQLA